MLYFLAYAGGIEHLFTVDTTAVSPMVQPGAVSAIQGTFNGQNVSSIAFDNGRLLGAAGNMIFTINPNNTNTLSGTVTAQVNGAISGLAYVPSLPSNFIYVITNVGANAGANNNNVYIVDINTGQAVDYGPLSNGGTGSNPGDLTYDPSSKTLYSDDLSDGSLFSVSQILRIRSLSIYQVYISASDSTGIFEDASYYPGVGLLPFGPGLNDPDTAQALRIVNTGGAVQIIASPPGSGDSLIGARTRIVLPTTTNQLAPLLTAVVEDNPLAGFLSAPYPIGTAIRPGIVTAPGTTVGRIQFGGTVMGDVHIQGNIDTFYAGWIITGDTQGALLNTVIDPGNFTVNGDIRNLLTVSSIGTDTDLGLLGPTYVTGFDMHVGGTVGFVQSNDSIFGNINTTANPAAPNLTNVIEKFNDIPGVQSWLAGNLNGSPFLRHETFADPVDVGSLPASPFTTPSVTVINGTLYADPVNANFVDYYGVALLAGQTITAQVVTNPPGMPIDLGVFNPDGSLIASDYNPVAPGQTFQQQFRFTADRPGVYRFAAAGTGNTGFLESAGGPVGDINYTITISGVGDISVGGISATKNIVDNVDPSAPESSFGVQNGDFGALHAGGFFASTNNGDTLDIESGNLRDIDAGGVGINTDTSLGAYPGIQVPVGSVGLIASTINGIYFNDPPPPFLPPAIGGTFQVISSAADLASKLIADGNIGVIRAASISSKPGPDAYTVNAQNNPSTPGHIDLIDSTGDFGSNGVGGPHINTGPEGNVGYIRVGGNTFSDSTFGGGFPAETLYQPGESATLTDDSAARVVITPTETPIGVPITGNSAPDPTGITVNPNLPQMFINAYGIEGSGGVAIIDIICSGGIDVTGGGDNPGQTVQIGRIDVRGPGEAIITSPTAPPTVGTTPTKVQPSPPSGSSGTANPGYYTGPNTAGPLNRLEPLPNPPEIDPTATTPLDVNLTGPARMDVFEVDGGAFSSITDSTGGDIVNVRSTSIGTISTGGMIGVAQSHTGAALNGEATVVNTFPLVNARNAIVSNTIVTVQAKNGYGNLDVNGAVGYLNGAVVGPNHIAGSVFSIAISGGINSSGSARSLKPASMPTVSLA